MSQVTDKLYSHAITTLVVIGTDCIGSYISNYHTITTTTACLDIYAFIVILYEKILPSNIIYCTVLTSGKKTILLNYRTYVYFTSRWRKSIIPRVTNYSNYHNFYKDHNQMRSHVHACNVSPFWIFHSEFIPVWISSFISLLFFLFVLFL